MVIADCIFAYPCEPKGRGDLCNRLNEGLKLGQGGEDGFAEDVV